MQTAGDVGVMGVRGLFCAQLVVLAAVGNNLQPAATRNNRLESLDEGVERVAGIGLLGPKRVADDLLGQSMFVCGEEERHELLLHGSESHGAVPAVIETLCLCVEGQSAQHGVSAMLPPQTGYGTRQPQQGRQREREGQTLVGQCEDRGRRTIGIPLKDDGRLGPVPAHLAAAKARPRFVHGIAHHRPFAQGGYLQVAAIVADGVGRNPALALGVQRLGQGLVHVGYDESLGAAVAV